ncbi:MAG: hypothetical protein ACK6BG_01065 [Cyanobacteriota bacterium]
MSISTLTTAKFLRSEPMAQWQPLPRRCQALELLNDYRNIHVPAPCLVLEEETGKISASCNGFIDWWLTIHGMPKPDDIYWRRLDECYTLLQLPSRFTVVDQPLVYLSPVYHGWNIGHDLSVTLFTLLAYQKTLQNADRLGLRTEDLGVAVSCASLSKSVNIDAVLRSFVPQNRIFDMQPGVAYNFTSLILPPNCFFNLEYDIEMVRPLTEHLKRQINSNPIYQAALDSIIHNCAGRFVLCKQESHTSARRLGMMPTWVQAELSQRSWFIIDPEKMALFEVIYLLSHASEVLLGSGAIQYAHKLFIGDSARIHLLFDNPNYRANPHQQENRVNIPEHRWNEDPQWQRLLASLP